LIGLSVTQGNGSSENVLVGHGSSIGAASNSNVVVGQSAAAGDNVITAVVLGASASVLAGVSVCIGPSATISIDGISSVVIGGNAASTAEAAVVVGPGSSVASDYATALGANSIIGTDDEGCVAINGTIGNNAAGSVNISGTVNANCSYTVIIGPTNIASAGARGNAIGWNNTINAAVLAASILGDHCTVTGDGGIAIGSYATAGANAVVFGDSSPHAVSAAIHSFTVRGYNAGALDTLVAIDNPASGSTGVTVVFYSGVGAPVNRVLKAATSGSVPGGSLMVYIDP
jgi:hypothetical protein